MPLEQSIYEESHNILTERRTRANQQAAQLQDRMRAQNPRVAQVERALAASSAQVVKAVLDRADVTAVVARIRDENLALQTELATILREAGETVTNFEPQYTCPLCRDTGYVDQKRCACLDALLKELAVQHLERSAQVKLPTFDSLTTAYYPDTAENGMSPRVRMERVLDFCRHYAADFSNESESLLLCGPTGTGKTQVSLAIARTAAEKGFGVVYGPAGRLFHQLEREHFGRADGDTLEKLSACDLLVIDDLGTEFTGPFYTASLYELLNTRQLAGLPTIISTNLSLGQIAERYGEAVASRVIGAFQPIVFVGRDIRQVKREQLLR
ncbi:MAG: ATP-binding protein [Clostridia bacterium]|nr:ATP-binding protein [Clostridia bacterium]